MRFVAGRAAAAEVCFEAEPWRIVRTAVAKMLAEPMRIGRAAAEEHLQRGCAGADCPDSHGKDAGGAPVDGIGHHSRDVAGRAARAER